MATAVIAATALELPIAFELTTPILIPPAGSRQPDLVYFIGGGLSTLRDDPSHLGPCLIQQQGRISIVIRLLLSQEEQTTSGGSSCRRHW